MRLNVCYEYQRIKFQCKIGSKFSHLLIGQGRSLFITKKMNSATLFFQIELTIEIFRQDMN